MGDLFCYYGRCDAFTATFIGMGYLIICGPFVAACIWILIIQPTQFTRRLILTGSWAGAKGHAYGTRRRRKFIRLTTPTKPV